MWARNEETLLEGVWARRQDAAEEVAAASGTRAFTSFEQLLDSVDAVSFAVPPDVQAVYGARAARAGKSLALDKPIAMDLAGAEALAGAVEEAGVGTQVLLTWRYAAAVRSWLAEVSEVGVVGAKGEFISGSALGGLFATPWRIEKGALLDLGPHIIDLLDAALGPVVGVRAHGDARRWIGVLLEHASGVVSEVSMSARSAVEPSRAAAAVFTEAGVVEIDTAAEVGPKAISTFASEFVTTAKQGLGGHDLDVRRGLHLQRILEEAGAQLAQ